MANHAKSAAEHPSAADWAAARGAKWRDNLRGMEASLAPVDAPLIDALELTAPCRIADLACGGGGTTLAILRSAPPGSVVHGHDISPELIEAARARAPAGDALQFSVTDVATAAPPAQRYGRLTSRFGVMFFDDPPAAFSSLSRWLQPDGRLAFATWGHPADNPWMTSLRDAVGEVVEVPPFDPDAPGPFRYAQPGKLIALLERAGFRELEATEWRGELPVGGGLAAAPAARFALASFAMGELVADEESRARAQQALTARFAERERGGIVLMPASVNLFTGRGPQL
jgi:SAM-dependent methyltransferase